MKTYTIPAETMEAVTKALEFCLAYADVAADICCASDPIHAENQRAREALTLLRSIHPNPEPSQDRQRALEALEKLRQCAFLGQSNPATATFQIADDCKAIIKDFIQSTPSNCAGISPMDTAPKDGTPILALVKYYPVLGKEDEYMWVVVSYQAVYGDLYQPKWTCVAYDAFSYDPLGWIPLPPLSECFLKVKK